MRLGRIIKSWSREGFVDAKDMGLEFVEFCCNSQKDAEKFIAMKDEIRASSRETGIDIASVGRWNHDVQENGALVPERRESYFALMRAAAELGAKVFVCGINYDGTLSLYKNYQNAIAFLGELTEEGKRLGIRVAVQNCNWNNFIVSPREWEVVLGEIPELMIKFDPSHSYNRGADYLKELSDWGERVAYFHVKGTVHAGSRAVDDPPAGMDDIAWPSVFAVLYSRGYDGDLSIEPHSSVWHGELGTAGVKFTIDYIRRFILK